MIGQPVEHQQPMGRPLPGVDHPSAWSTAGPAVDAGAVVKDAAGRSLAESAVDGSPVAAVRSLVREPAAGRWSVESRFPWVHFVPEGSEPRAQGWKIHVSASLQDAGAIVDRLVPLLVGAGVPFKVAATPEYHARLNGARCPRGLAGKFLTAYPVDDGQARELARLLDERSAGLNGPRILSDLPVRDGSVVHLRYGAFRALRRLGDDGMYRLVVHAPDGAPVEDVRAAGATPPVWSPKAPVPDGPAPVGPGATRPAIGPHGRYRVERAIRHANRGGVYVATDSDTGRTVVLKEARPHVVSGTPPIDVRAVLRAEFATLQRFADSGLTPTPVELFEQDGHAFLVLEHIPGATLRSLVGGRAKLVDGGDPVGLIVALADAVAESAGRGLVLGDFNPNNILIEPSGRVRVVDLEYAGQDGTAPLVPGGGTLGYSAPEQLRGAARTTAADVYSLGATALFVLTAADPLFPAEPAEATACLREWLDVAAEIDGIGTGLVELLIRCLHHDPARRPTAAAVLEGLARHPTVPASRDAAGLIPVARLLRAENDLIDHLGRLADAADSVALQSCAGGSAHRAGAYHGSSGPLFVLAGHAHLRPDRPLLRTVEILAASVRRELADDMRLPGLYFGLSGPAWALVRAGQATSRPDLIDAGFDVAAALPLDHPAVDVTHGAAGAVLALVALTEGNTAPATALRPILGLAVDRVHRAVEIELDTVENGATGRLERRGYGFGHGLAGMATALLLGAARLGEPEPFATAARVGDLLVRVAQRGPSGSTWARGPLEPTTSMLHWCHGSSGVGTFLIRLHAATGRQEFLDEAIAAGDAVAAHLPRMTNAYCHGLPGNGDSLLDLFRSTGDERWLLRAHHAARLMFARRSDAGGRTIPVDETGMGHSADFGVGLAGVLAFVTRLAHDVERAWMPAVATDPVSPPAPVPTMSGRR